MWNKKDYDTELDREVAEYNRRSNASNNLDDFRRDDFVFKDDDTFVKYNYLSDEEFIYIRQNIHDKKRIDEILSFYKDDINKYREAKRVIEQMREDIEKQEKTIINTQENEEVEEKKKTSGIIRGVFAAIFISVFLFNTFTDITSDDIWYWDDEEISEKFVTQNEFDELIQLNFVYYYYDKVTEISTDIKDGPISKGDVVDLSWQMYLEGERYSFGDSSGREKTLIGNSAFMDGIDEQLIGKKKGDTIKVEFVIPDNDFMYEDIAGKSGYSNITIYNVYKAPSDEEIIEHFSEIYEIEFENVEEIKNYIREMLVKYFEEDHYIIEETTTV